MLINKDIYLRLKQIIMQLSGDNVTRFAEKIGQKQNTILGYLKPEGQYKIKISMLYDVLSNYPEVNPVWLFTGEGEMLGNPAAQDALMTPLEREMRTFEELMTKKGAPNERIWAGLEARMGVAESKRTYGGAESSPSSGPLRVHESTDDFGETDI